MKVDNGVSVEINHKDTKALRKTNASELDAFFVVSLCRRGYFRFSYPQFHSLLSAFVPSWFSLPRKNRRGAV